MKTIFLISFVGSLCVSCGCFAQKKWVNITEIGVQLGKIQTKNDFNYYGYSPSSSLFASSGRYAYPPLPNNYGVNRNNLSIQTFNGIQLKNGFVPGITLGADWYGNSQFFPVMAALRRDVFKKQRRVSPYYSVDAGYAFRGFGYDKDLQGGFVWSAGGGLRINTGNSTGLTLSVAYKQQNAYFTAPIDGVYTLAQREDRVYNRIALRMGICF